ncbi:vesicle transport protein GOT1B isoform 2 [Mus musculus]|uniref:vesicle transport protein GOT1B isoform 2 n=1 Tax=Mus musculus TaxID=10090 RepID=UPI0023A94816|nr:vesicle transport protein GOT1B isoform 2 [Mus musculus]
MISLTDTQKIGMGLTGFGVFFLFFGMILFFDKALLAIGNGLFPSGRWLYQKSTCPRIPPKSTWNQIIRRQSWRKQQYGITTRTEELKYCILYKALWKNTQHKIKVHELGCKVPYRSLKCTPSKVPTAVAEAAAEAAAGL